MSSSTATVFVTSPDTRSERRYDLHITVEQLKVFSFPGNIGFESWNLIFFSTGEIGARHWDLGRFSKDYIT